MSGTKKLRSKYTRLLGRLDNLKSDREKTRNRIRSIAKEMQVAKQGQRIIQAVAEETQRTIEFEMSEIGSLALSSVFKDPYTLNVKFVGYGSSRNDCHITFEQDGYEFLPGEDEVGNGAEDVASFALKTASHSISETEMRNILLVDEPFLGLKGEEANYLALKLVYQLSHELGLQIIMVSDERVDRSLIKETADKVFEVTKDGDVSKVEEL